MSEPEVPSVLICGPDRVPIAGSSQDTCRGCAAVVWLSPASRKIADTVGATIYCVDCANRLGLLKDAEVRVTREQFEEVRKHIREQDRA